MPPSGILFLGYTHNCEHRNNKRPLDQSLLSNFPELKAFGPPNLKSVGEHKSLLIHSKYFLREPKCFDPTAIIRATERIIADYPHSKSPRPMTRSEILYIIDSQIKMDSTPGRPFEQLGCHDNADVVEKCLDILIDEVFRLYDKYSGEDEPPPNPLDLYLGGWTWGCHDHVKSEATKIEKIEQGKCRIIDAFNLAEQIFDKWLYNTQNKLEISLWKHIPSKVGFDITSEENIRDFVDSVPRIVAGADVSGWDWQFDNRLYASDYAHRCMLISDLTPLIERCIRRRHFVVSRCPMVLSNGRVYAPVKPGKMKSGWSNTSSSNSRQRVFLGYLIDVPWIIAQGDDDLESPVDNAVEKYRELGYELKIYERFVDSFEFCGHSFNRDYVSTFLNPTKALYHLLEGGITHDKLLGFKFALRTQPELFKSYMLRIRDYYKSGTAANDLKDESRE